MKHLVNIVVCAGLLAGLSWLPAGDPPALPAGHPSVPKSQTKSGDLPAGHPNLDQLMGASTQPVGPGKLTIRTVQGTKGGPIVSGEAVFVELYGEGSKVIKTIQTKLGAKGQAEVEIPLTVICQPVVHITHGGVGYEGICKVMDRRHTGQDLEMTIFESTETPPDMSIGMRHVIVHVVPEGLRVTEMFSITNPTDKAWVGTADGGAGSKRTTLSIPLSAGAKDLSVADAPEGAMEIRDGKLVGLLPVLPGQAELQLQYLVPTTAGKADLTITAPWAVGRVFVFIPDDGSTVTATGLESLGIRKTGEGNKRGYQATSLKAGQAATLSFSGLKLPAAAEPVKKSDARPVAPTSSSHLPQIAAGAGGVVILGGATALLIKSPKKTADRS